MRKALGLLLIFGLGVVVGPLLYALIAAAMPPRQIPVVSANEAEVGRLIAVYRAELDRGRLFMSIIPPPNGKECGYDPEKVFPGQFSGMAEARRAGSFSDYEGYYALDKWRNQQRDEGYIAAIHMKMAKDMSRFEAGFLRRCIQSTVFAGWCKQRVAAFADQVDRFGPESRNFFIGGGHEDRVVCRYVDGVAARNGLPLAPVFNQETADRARW